MSKITNPELEPSVTCGFFSSQDGDRKYNTEEISSLFDGLIKDGIYSTIGDAFTVTAAGGNNVTVGTGRAWFNHTWTYNAEPLPLTLDAAEVNRSRYDAIVIEINVNESVRDNSIKVLKGSSSSGAKPTMKKTEGVYQYPLCYIYRPAGSKAITAGNIKNEVGSTTPFVTGVVDTVNLETLTSQYLAALDELKDKLNSDFQTNYDAQTEAFNNAITEFTTWITGQEADYTTWLNSTQEDFSDWRDSQTEAFNKWSDNEKSSMTNWEDTQKSDFETWAAERKSVIDQWYETIKGQLSDGDLAVSLQSQINDNKTAIAEVKEQVEGLAVISNDEIDALFS